MRTLVLRVVGVVASVACCIAYASAQDTPDSMRASEPSIPDLVNPRVLPQFPGGSERLFEFLRKEMKYPLAGETCKQGRVFVEFVVELDSTLTNERVLRGIDPELDAEALRIVRSMPKWKPGTFNGKPIVSRLVVPVNFKLE